MSTITEAKRESHLSKQYRWPDDVVESLRDRVAKMVATGQASITYRSSTGRKRMGMRLPRKPVWTLWVGDLGVDISKTAAAYAANLMQPAPDLKKIEERGEAAYRQELA